MDRPLVRPRRRWLAWACALGAAVALGATAARGLARPSAPSIEAGEVVLERVTSGTFVREVEGPGALEADGAEWVTAVQPGRVSRVLVKAGATVEAGQLLLALDNPELSLSALAAEERLSAERVEWVTASMQLRDATAAREGTSGELAAQVAEARSRREQAERLRAERLEGPGEVWSWTAKEQAASARLLAERARAGQAEREASALRGAHEQRRRTLEAVVAFRKAQLASLAVAAPSAGVVQELSVEAGQWVSTGTALGKIIQPSRLRAALQIPEAQAAEVAVGQRVRLSLSGEQVAGSVARVSPSAKAGSVRVEVSLLGELPAGARPDVRVHGAVEIDVAERALTVRRPPGVTANAAAQVWRRAAGGLRRTRVELGAASATRIEVRAGLSEGDEIVVSDTSRWGGLDALSMR